MRETIVKYVTMADILGEQVSLRINKETTSKTFIGGIFTIQLVIALVVIFWIFSSDLLNHENPAMAEETQVLTNRPKIDLNPGGIQIAFSFSNDGSLIIDKPNYFKFYSNLIYNNNSADSDSNTENLKVRTCIREDFPAISDDTFYGIMLNKMNCMDKLNHTINGFWDEQTVQYLTIGVSACVNETETDNCSDYSEIKEFLDHGPYYFNIYVINTQINPKNYYNPITSYVLNKYVQVSGSTYKVLTLFLKKQQLHSDDSFIFTSDHRFNSSSFDFIDRDDSEVGKDLRFVQYSIYSSNKFVIYHRTYSKISEVLADVGGLSSVFFMALKIMCYFFTNIQHDEIILNKIFDYDLEVIENEFNRSRYSDNFNFKNFFKQRRSSALGIDNIQTIRTIRVNKGSNTSINANSEKSDNNNKNDQNILAMVQNTRNQAFDKMSVHSFESKMIIENINSNNINKNNSKKLDPLSQVNEMEKPQRNSLINLEENNEEISDAVIKKILTTKDKYKLSFTFFEIIKGFCLRCLVDRNTKNKLQLYKKSEAVLDRFLDISNIVHTLDEYEKFKIIMMSKEQLALFNFISKDIYSVNNKFDSNTFSELREMNKNEAVLAKIIIKFIKKINEETDESNIPELDRKLFSFLNYEMKRNLLNC